MVVMENKTQTTNENKNREELPEVYIDDMLMSLKYYVDEHQAHVRLVAPEACTGCKSKDCLYFCPVGAYREDRTGGILISHQSCIECGSCRVMCPLSNVEWRYPRGGYGVAYKFG
jgi:ferredoxin like protein